MVILFWVELQRLIIHIGKVMTAPRNIVAHFPKEGHGSSTVGHLLSKTAKHMPDPYERKREMEAVRKLIEYFF